MANKKIIWSYKAKIEFRKILEFFNERNGSETYSLKLLLETEDLLVTLAKSELIGRLTSNEKTRVIPLKTYLIFYEINKDSIEILSFWDNRQDELKKKFK